MLRLQSGLSYHEVDVDVVVLSGHYIGAEMNDLGYWVENFV